MMELDDLPPEVLFQIAVSINNPLGFRAFALTCKLFFAIATNLQNKMKNKFLQSEETKDAFGYRVTFERLPNGWKHGLERRYWDGTDQLYLEIPWLNGKQYGNEVALHKDGTVKYIKRWKNGKQQGKEKHWNEDGSVLLTAHWKDGNKHGWERWRGLKGRTTVTRWKNGERETTLEGNKIKITQ